MAWPTTDKPRTHFVTLRLNDDEANDLDWLTAQTGGKSRSDTVRTAVLRVVKAERKRVASRKKSGTPGGKMRDEDE